MPELSLIDRLPTLIEAASSVVESIDLEQLLRRLVGEARSATGARYAALGVIGEHGVLTAFLHEGIPPEQVAKIGTLPKGLGVLGTVVREKKTIRLDSISSHPDSYGFPENHPKMNTFLGVPVMAGDKAYGNLYLADKEGGFSDFDVVLVEALSRIAGSALVTARLHERLKSLAVVEDRERIARDLHDSVIQDLFAVGLGLQGISGRVRDTTAASTLDSAVDRLDHAVETLRSYVFRLRAGDHQAPQLDERLQELVARMGSAYPSVVRLELGLSGMGDEGLEDEVVKIVTEGLSNALRHSRATNIDVAVTAEGGWWLVTIRDDGIGFDQEKVKKGMGLNNLAARASRLQGELLVISEPGKGAAVEVRLPKVD